jgi:uncharacterized protein
MEDIMIRVRKLVLLIVCVIILAMGGDALGLKAAIGVGAWEAVQQSISYVTGIKVGTIGIFFNCSCIIAELIMLRKKFRPIQSLQVLVCIIIGIVVNFMLYDVYTFLIPAYWQRVILILVSYILGPMALGAIMLLDIVTLPLEGFCKVVSDVTPISFPVMRQLMDVISIVVSIIITFGFGIPLTVREGTVIGMLIFGPLLGIFMKMEKPVFLKLGLMEE